MSSSSSAIEQFISAARDMYISRLLAGSAATLLLYDWILVFPIELETIYTSRLTLPKVLFFYIRLFTPPGVILSAFHLSDLRPPLSVPFCKFWLTVAVLGLPTSLVAANGLLALRLVALYKRQKYVVWSIYILFFVSYATTFGLLIQGYIIFIAEMTYYTPLQICMSLKNSKTFSGVFYAPAIFETFIFSLTAYRAWKDAKIISRSGNAPFLTVIYRDGAIAFLVMIGLRIWNMWIYTTAPLSSYNMGTVFMWSVNTVLTTRVYINLAWLGRKPASESVVSPATSGGGTAIRMRVRYTEVDFDARLGTVPALSKVNV